MLVAALVTLAVAGVLTPALAAWARRRNFLDVPNYRSSHVVATPRLGGVAIVIAVLAGLGVFRLMDGPIASTTMAVVSGALSIALLGLIDDFTPLKPAVRLIVQTLVAAVLVRTLGPVPLPWVDPEGLAAAFITVFWIVAFTNAYNFMDGIDGIAGAQAVVGGIGWLAAGLMTGQPQTAALGVLLAAASAGFLLHNWHPARVFMGDAGSGFFGFLFAALPLLALPGETSKWWAAVFLMWPFLLDTGFTFVRRASRGENVLSAHRSHIYQRFVITGRSHSTVSLLYGGLALLGLVAAVSVIGGNTLLLAAVCVVMLAVSGALWWSVTVREAALVRHERGAAF